MEISTHHDYFTGRAIIVDASQDPTRMANKELANRFSVVHKTVLVENPRIKPRPHAQT